MKLLFTLPLLLNSLLVTGLFAQSDWPKEQRTPSGAQLKMFEWQAESLSGNNLQARAAIAYQEKGQEDPAFGVIWFSATLDDRGHEWYARQIHINSIKMPDETSEARSGEIRALIESQVADWNIRLSRSKLNEQLKITTEERKVAGEISTTAPQIIYSQKPAILVNIDGPARLQVHSEWAMETVVNSPFTIIRHSNNNFYLYGGKHWYRAAAATGPYNYTTEVPSSLHSIEFSINEAYKKANTAYEKAEYNISSIIVTTSPAELLQTQGEPKFSAVQGTDLLYVSNTEDDIFMDVKTQQYYVLLAGRWYRSRTLSGQWQYISADALPGDFARIPNGSEKESVLASVAGTAAARDAIEEAQLPQTARVDRRSATMNVDYDGDPEFEAIEGTRLHYAVNSPYSVLRYRNRYYAVDNGVWFESYSARGPWVVSVERPYEVYLIPPRYPVYHLKYVYIYEVAPDYVYMGYTPGYLNSYVYGPTIVYGTGYYYRPWRGHRYYARPCTWGYNMRYAPWVGWGFGIDISFGWFHIGIGNSYPHYYGNNYGYNSWYRGGWWGPSYYRPNYCERNYYRYDRYRQNNYYVNNTYINYSNNVYNYRRDVRSRDNQRHSDYRGRDWVRNDDRRNNNDRYDNRGGNNYNDRGRDNRPNNGNYNDRGRDNNGRNNPTNNRGNNNRQDERPGREARSGNDGNDRNRNPFPNGNGRIENQRDLRNDPPDVRNRRDNERVPANERSGRDSRSGNDAPVVPDNRGPVVERRNAPERQPGNNQPPVRESRTREQESRPPQSTRTQESGPQRSYEPSRQSGNRGGNSNGSGNAGNNRGASGERGRRGG